MIGTPYLWPSAGLDPGGLQHMLVLGAVVSPKLPAEKGEHLVQHQAGLGHVGPAGGDLTSSIFCSVFLGTSILGTVFLIPFVLRKGCNRLYWVRLFSLVYTWWTRFLQV